MPFPIVTMNVVMEMSVVYISLFQDGGPVTPEPRERHLRSLANAYLMREERSDVGRRECNHILPQLEAALPFFRKS